MIIPTRVRTARVAHRCDGYPRCAGIEPGEQYEDWRLPPGRDVNTGSCWWKVKVHHPASPDGVAATGCELAAYRENARRNAQKSQWVTAVRTGSVPGHRVPGLGGPGASPGTDDPHADQAAAWNGCG